MIIYGLKAKGILKYFENYKSMFSKKLFKTKEAAEDHKLEFLKSCVDNKNDLYDLRHDDNFEMTVEQFELVD